MASAIKGAIGHGEYYVKLRAVAVDMLVSYPRKTKNGSWPLLVRDQCCRNVFARRPVKIVTIIVLCQDLLANDQSLMMNYRYRICSRNGCNGAGARILVSYAQL